MTAVPMPNAVPPCARRAAAVIEDPRLEVVEAPGTADSAAVQDALELLVKWAVRAHQRGRLAVDDVATTPDLAAVEVGKQA
jgi:hypothetical protein